VVLGRSFSRRSRKGNYYPFIKWLIKKNRLAWQTATKLRSLYRSVAVAYRTHPDIIGRIHYDDSSYNESSSHHYATVGASAVAILDKALHLASKSFEQVHSCLDMPCGYGRVLRILQTKIPPDKIDACDLDRRAVKFCAREFGAQPVFSKPNLEEVTFPRSYDLIWVGSLLTHFPKTQFCTSFRVFHRILEPGGLLAVTTHGVYSVDSVGHYGALSKSPAEIKIILKGHGFYFAPYIGEDTYGISISTKGFVLEQAERESKHGLKFLQYLERGWDNHQDCYIFQKL
jgi:SAM-dependent methyltransferase